MTHQFTCLPFSLCTAPRVFTKTLKPVVEMLRSMGICLVIYIDNLLLMATTSSSLIEHIHTTLFLLETAGFIVNQKKSLLEPTQEIEFLRMVINSKEMIVDSRAQRQRISNKKPGAYSTTPALQPNLYHN